MNYLLIGRVNVGKSSSVNACGNLLASAIPDIKSRIIRCDIY